MSNSAIIKSTGQQVSVISVNGGWTTVMDEMGTEFKVRNSAVEIETKHNNQLIASDDDFEVERSESDDPDHNDAPDGFNTLDDVKEELIDDLPTKRKLRHVKNSTYNPEDMRKLTSAAGNLSYDCGDGVARQLERKSLMEVYEIAAAKLGIPQEQLLAKYQHLNPGMQRMNLGNRIRAAASKQMKEKIQALEK